MNLFSEGGINHPYLAIDTYRPSPFREGESKDPSCESSKDRPPKEGDAR